MKFDKIIMECFSSYLSGNTVSLHCEIQPFTLLMEIITTHECSEIWSTQIRYMDKIQSLCNIVMRRAVSRQRLCEHVPTPTDTYAGIEVLLETVFSTRSVPRSYKDGSWDNRFSSLRELWGKEAVRREPPFREYSIAWSWRISTVRSRYHWTAGEDAAGWKRLSERCVWFVKCGD
jgi:hypothetical protein